MNPPAHEEVPTVNDDLREMIALFRYGVISELVSRPLAPGEKERKLTEIASKVWTIPGTTRCTIGRSTVNDWVAQYEAMGLAGLKPRPRSDKGTSRTIPEAVADLLLSMRGERPKASTESIIRAVRLSGKVDASVRLPPTTVNRLFAAHGVPVQPPGKVEADAMAFTHPYAGDLWMADVMHGPRLLVPGRCRGTKTYLHAFIDDASRLVPFAGFYLTESSACFQDALKQALLRRGIPRRLYCDNGCVYRSHHLRLICATLGITLIHSRPHQPRGRGKIERFFRHVRSAFLPHLSEKHLAELAALNRVFWAWLEAEYHHSVHRGINATPLDRVLQDADKLRPAPEDLDRLMRMKRTRRVAPDRTVRLDGRIYEAPDGFAGEKVEVLYDPYEPSRPVHMKRPGEQEEFRLRLLDAQTNARMARAPRQAEPDPTPPKTGINYLDLITEQHERPSHTRGDGPCTPTSSD